MLCEWEGGGQNTEAHNVTRQQGGIVRKLSAYGYCLTHTCRLLDYFKIGINYIGT